MKPDRPRLRLVLLGPIQAHDENRVDLLPRGRKARAMLAFLALTGPEPATRDSLAALLWSRREPEQARASFRQTLHELHTALAPVPDALFSERGLVGLREEVVWCDALAVLRGLPAAPETFGRLGDTLDGLDPAFDRWLADQRSQFDATVIRLAEAVLDKELPPAQVIGAARRVLTLVPTNEAACRALMAAHLALAEPAAGLAAYDRCAAALATAGLGPGPLTRAARSALLAGADPAAPAPARTAGVRLGVMPFRSLDGGDTAGLSIGLAEEITTALSRFRWMLLIASPSVAAIADEERSTSQRWRALNLDFLLDGTVQRNGGRVRVNARLLDLRGAEQLVWAGRFDREGDDIITLQDEIAAETVAQVDPELLLREGQRAQGRPPSSSSAYDMVLRAIPALYGLERQAFVEAGEALEQAVALDTRYATAQAWWAFWHVFLVGQGWAAEPEAAMLRAGQLAQRAVALDPSDARALTIAGHVQAFLHHRIPEALALHERALSLNPNLPLAWCFAGLAHCYGGAHSEAIRHIGQAMRLSPFDPHTFFFEMSLTMPHLMQGDYERVVELSQRAAALNPGLSSTYKGYLSALGHLGRTEAASHIRSRLLALEPDFTLQEAASRSPLLRAADIAIYVEGLRRAGLAEAPTAIH